MYDLIIVRGAPGIGKTTLGELLKNDDFFCAVIDIDEVRGMFLGEKFICHENEEYYKALELTILMVRNLRTQFVKPILITDVLAEELLEYFIIKVKNLSYLIINLFASNEILMQRIENRSGGYKEIDVSLKINTKITQDTKYKFINLDTSFLNPRSIRHCIYRIIENN